MARIKAAVRDGRCVITEHADDEAQLDGFTSFDVESALLDGELHRRYTEDARGTRYEILGPAEDGRLMHVVCRFVFGSQLRLITVFEATDENHES